MTINLPSAGSVIFFAEANDSIAKLFEDIRREDLNINKLECLYEESNSYVSHCTQVKDLIRNKVSFVIEDKIYKLKTVDSALNSYHHMTSDNFIQVNDIRDVVHQMYLCALRKKVEKDSRYCISIEEYFSWSEDLRISRNQAMLLLRGMHQAGLIFYFESNPRFNKYIFNKTDVIISSLAGALGSELSSQEKVRKNTELRQIEAEISNLDVQKKKYDIIAKRRAKCWLWSGFVCLTMQFSVLARMVWIDFNWDIIEPITYFINFSATILAFTFFFKSKEDYTYSALEKKIIDRTLRKLYIKNRFNWTEWHNLDKKRTELREYLKRGSEL
ncbi:calcium uniporter protein, mitochondrial-like [Schistocerca gregaria]|uniref:calcium uniporter protein, mitochondrial-like n=1 Tax=Schistocerca gregaria TaxID=7010 RepID=UPI00211E0307|nr:calcium uniporter protein, mitochondrial-like [Schistocerca gregaria]